MARPRRESPSPNAKERIKEAFWALYQSRPIGKISVKEIVALAGCNRTTFYYYYCDVYAVLEEIELHCLPVELPSLIVQIITGERNYDEIAAFVSSHQALYKQICYLLSAHGDPGFAQRFKNEMLRLWSAAAGISFAGLDKTLRLRLELIIGGLMSLFACSGNGEAIALEEIAETMQTVIAQELPQLLPTGRLKV